MKKKFLVAFTAVLVFGLTIAAYAFNNNSLTASGDKTSACPMSKSAAASAHKSGEKDACCGMADCCKDGKCSMGGACCKDKDACPMKDKMNDKKDNSTAGVDYSKITFTDAAAGEDCCASGASCCKSGASCCNGKHS